MGEPVSTDVQLLESAQAWVETLLYRWLVHGLHIGRVADGIADLVRVQGQEALYHLTSGEVDAEELARLARAAAGLGRDVRSVLETPPPGDRVAGRLTELVHILALDEAATDVVLFLVVLSHSPALARTASFAAGSRGLTLSLVTEVLAGDRRHAERSQVGWMGSLAPATRYGLVEITPPDGTHRRHATIELSARFEHYLLDDVRPEGEAPGTTSALDCSCAGVDVVGSSQSLAAVPLCISPQSLAAVRKLRLAPGETIVVYGDEGACDTHHVGRHLAAGGGELVCVNLRSWLGHDDATITQRLKWARREALLRRCPVCIQHIEVLVPVSPERSAAGMRDVEVLGDALVRELRVEDVLTTWVLSTRQPRRLIRRLGARCSSLSLRPVSLETRLEYWRALLERRGVSLASSCDSRGLLSTFQLGPAAIRDLVDDVARAQDTSDGSVRNSTLFSAAESIAPNLFGGLAERVRLDYERADLVLTERATASFEELLAANRHSDAIEEILGPAHRSSRSGAVTALFFGPPGTGKTMAASVLARELGRALYRMDLSRIQSKWAGETEKNMEQLFSQAAREGQRAILLVDEVDSLAANRSSSVESSGDRFANAMTNYLLQQLDSFTGTIVMTTNNEGAIDPAFKRRMKFRIELDRPDEATRALLWRRLLPPALRRGPDGDDGATDGAGDGSLHEDVEHEIALLAEDFDLSGAEIANVLERTARRVSAGGLELSFDTIRAACVDELRTSGRLVRDVAAAEELHGWSADDPA